MLTSPLKLSVLTCCCWKLNRHPLIQLCPWGTCSCSRRSRWNKMAVQRVSQRGVRTTPPRDISLLGWETLGYLIGGSWPHHLRRKRWLLFLGQRLQEVVMASHSCVSWILAFFFLLLGCHWHFEVSTCVCSILKSVAGNYVSKPLQPAEKYFRSCSLTSVEPVFFHSYEPSWPWWRGFWQAAATIGRTGTGMCFAANLEK